MRRRSWLRVEYYTFALLLLTELKTWEEYFGFFFHLQLDNCVITAIAMGDEDARNRSLVKEWCQTDLVMVMALSPLMSPANIDTLCHALSPNRAWDGCHWTVLQNCVFITDASFFLVFLTLYSPLAMRALQTVAPVIACPNLHQSVGWNSIILATLPLFC